VSQASRPEAAPGRIKGAAFREFVAWYEQELGRAQLLTLLRSIPDDLRRELELDPARESLGMRSTRCSTPSSPASIPTDAESRSSGPPTR
jgi:hypothetical protein